MTICTVERHRNVLCHITPPPVDNVGVAPLGDPPDVVLTQIGEKVRALIVNADCVYRNAHIDLYSIMPNHIHMIIAIRDMTDEPNQASSQRAYIPQVINAIKALSTKAAGQPLWQRGYYEHVVRNSHEHDDTRKYISDTNI